MAGWLSPLYLNTYTSGHAPCSQSLVWLDPLHFHKISRLPQAPHPLIILPGTISSHRNTHPFHLLPTLDSLDCPFPSGLPWPGPQGRDVPVVTAGGPGPLQGLPVLRCFPWDCVEGRTRSPTQHFIPSLYVCESLKELRDLILFFVCLNFPLK